MDVDLKQLRQINETLEQVQQEIIARAEAVKGSMPYGGFSQPPTVNGQPLIDLLKAEPEKTELYLGLAANEEWDRGYLQGLLDAARLVLPQERIPDWMTDQRGEQEPAGPDYDGDWMIVPD